MKTIKVPQKPDMMHEIKDDVFQDLCNLSDDVSNCFDVADDISRDDIKKMVMNVIEQRIKDVVATLTDVKPDVAELVKDKSFVEDVLDNIDSTELTDNAKDSIKNLAGYIGGIMCLKVNNLADEMKVEAFARQLYPIYADQQTNFLF